MLGITIMFTLNGEKREYQYDESQKDIANAFWQTIVNDDQYQNIKGVKPDGTVIIPKKETEKCYAVNVVFPSSDKVYTYGSKSKVETGDEVIVYTCNGIQIVTVKECTKIEESNLANLTNGKKSKWIQGKFIRF